MRPAYLLPILASLLSCKVLEDASEQLTPTTSSAAGPASAAAAPAPTTAVPQSFQLQKFAVGQFVEYRMEGTGPVNRYAWAVLAKEDDAFWLQLVSTVEGKDHVVHLLMPIEDGSGIDTAVPKKMKFKMPGAGVRELSGPMLSMARESTKSSFFLDMDPATIGQGSREDVTVPAGSFPGAFQWTGQTKWKGKKTETKFWSHPSVPVTGIVKGTDGTHTWTLAKHGQTGAKSEL